MAHFAKIVNGIVVEILVVDNEHEANGEAYLNGLGLVGKWVQTSYNANIRKKFAAEGDTYDAEKDVFIPKKVNASWVWDEILWAWVAPFPAPENGSYTWDESITNWVDANPTVIVSSPAAIEG